MSSNTRCKMDQVSFRFATHADYDAVLNIAPELYGGFDAMSEIFPTLMDEPSYHGVVGEAGGKVVAFGGAYVTCCETKLFSFGGRIHEDWRKLGLYKKLKEFLRSRLREGPFPNLAVEEFVTHGDNASLDAIFNSQTYRHLFTRSFKVLKVAPGVLGCSLVGGEIHWPNLWVENIGLVGLEKVLSDPATRQRIFPDRIFVGIRMFDPEVSEMDIIAKASPRIIASFSDDRGIQMISTGGAHRSTNYVIHIHFNTELTMECVSRHFVLHFLEHIKILAGEFETCTIFIRKEYMEEIYQRVEFTASVEESPFNPMEIYGFCRDI